MSALAGGRELVALVAEPVREFRYRRSHMCPAPLPDGFEVEDRALPYPRVEPEVRERLVRVAAAIATGATPEEVHGYLGDRFPVEVEELVSRRLDWQEMSAHVDVFLAAAGVTAIPTG